MACDEWKECFSKSNSYWEKAIKVMEDQELRDELEKLRYAYAVEVDGLQMTNDRLLREKLHIERESDLETGTFWRRLRHLFG